MKSLGRRPRRGPSGTGAGTHEPGRAEDPARQKAPWRRGPGDLDPKAIAVARAVLETERPELAILFGSRARGDWKEDSDIDVMIVTNEAVTKNSEERHMTKPDYRSLRPGTAAAVRAERKARETYQGPVRVEPVWVTPAEYRSNRACRNSLESVAASEGILMPRDPEN